MTYIREKVSSANTPANVHVSDVIGSKEDTSRVNLAESSLVSHNKAAYYHIHAPAGIYPSMANPIGLTANASAWTLGNKAAIIGHNETTLDALDAARDGTKGIATISNSEGTFAGTEAVGDGNYNLTIAIDGVEYADLATGALVSNDIDTALAALQTALRAATSGVETIAVDDDKIKVTSTDSEGPTSTVVITEGTTNGFLAALDAITGVTSVVDVPEDGIWTGGVRIPVAADNFSVGEYVKIIDTTNYDGVYQVTAQTAGYITITEEYEAETFTGSEVIRDCLGKPFDIHFVKVSDISANGYYELVLYAGEDGAEVEIGRIGFWRGSAQVKQDDSPIQIPVQAYGDRITAAVASGTSSADTCNVKIYYHEYLDSGV